MAPIALAKRRPRSFSPLFPVGLRTRRYMLNPSCWLARRSAAFRYGELYF
jgi:hypothetical protein